MAGAGTACSGTSNETTHPDAPLKSVPTKISSRLVSTPVWYIYALLPVLSIPVKLDVPWKLLVATIPVASVAKRGVSVASNHVVSALSQNAL